MNTPRVLIINGSVGAGKTSVADAIYKIFETTNDSCAFIDMDYLRSFYPRSASDPYGVEMGLLNLSSVSKNYIFKGITNFIIPTVVETKEEIEGHRSAVGSNARVLTVRLEASIETTHRRLESREGENSIEWYLNRAEELTKKLKQDSIDDIVIQTDNLSVQQIATQIFNKWDYNKKS